MTRKVYVNVTTRLILDLDDVIQVSNVLEEMTYSFDSTTEGASVEDTLILDYEVVDSK
jgi:hypothetical protein